MQEAIYPPETAIPLSDNQAYGHFDMERREYYVGCMCIVGV